MLHLKTLRLSLGAVVLLSTFYLLFVYSNGNAILETTAKPRTKSNATTFKQNSSKDLYSLHITSSEKLKNVNDMENFNIQRTEHSRDLIDRDSLLYSAKQQSQQWIIIVTQEIGESVSHIYKYDTASQPAKLVEKFSSRLDLELVDLSSNLRRSNAGLIRHMEYLLQEIPVEYRDLTPIVIKTNPILRDNGESLEDCATVMESIRDFMEQFPTFIPIKGDGISIIDDLEKVSYKWLGLSFLQRHRAGNNIIIDSTDDSISMAFPMEKDTHQLDKRNFFNYEDLKLFRMANDKFALTQIRNLINSKLLQDAIQSNTIDATRNNSPQDLETPCLPPNAILPNNLVQLPNGKKYSINFIGSKDNNNGEDCKFLIQDLLFSSNSKPFLPQDIAQSKIIPSKLSHQSGDIYLLSNFYKIFQPLLNFSNQPLNGFTLEDVMELTKKVCNNEFMLSHSTDIKDEFYEKLINDSNWCLDLSYHTSLLNKGYGIPLDQKLNVIDTIHDHQIDWALGVSLPLLNPTNWI
ncbi:hypothetical protein TBLA_0B02140 [Henningerozyma blattae CBS 6284]|uniref:guanosine-diphosphatase n=1 Tax=Henningerozyma blattae (strain ATCC 34711 / CBS 6284 / DSM 70876 / NBRC 10599 / NRRL Y-10934 / UCD 77-7) TaxID=1071380 RepID=I2GY54_HENB6|nr:hypothetical protein TBLA_0B02140 [Tetrapisispora blattae CBS 6284]CCH59056.1 hypothetical protein TBLA_0B02140 [Tetrapisispora blattae CBS 6284]